MSNILRRMVLTVLALALVCAMGTGTGFCADKAVFVFDREFIPMSFVRNQKPMGFEVEIFDAALAGTGITISYVPMKDWERAQSDLAGGVAHIASGMTRTHLRDRLFIYPQTPTFTLALKFFVKESSGITDVGAIRGRTVAVIRDSLYQRLLQEFGGVIVKLYDSGDAALKALVMGETEAYFGADLVTFDIIGREHYSDLRAVGMSLATVPVYYALYKGQADLRETVERGLARIHADGTYDRIYRKWFVPELSAAEMTALLESARGARGAAYLPNRGKGGGAAVLTRTGRTYVAGDVNGGPAGGYTALESALLQAVAAGDLEIRAVTAVDPEGRARILSGRERQLVREFGRGVLVMWEPNPGEYDMWMISRMLPFGGSATAR
ncbi:cytidine deaminase [Desulfobaculum xiamenense]|uniref:Cytidine deaminase n=1 Tax=Desulfobaculum xiamenense TaxID=995050 RepID=A0A846QGT8_9BACT|nr:transporter substrate-binding domain-containing protein [Desulfobaculum xiamenense]NJB67441.1 cytidine deaminase [Desulfobaculum xiamenense]